MTTQWHVGRGGQQSGPFSIEQLREMAARGELSPGDLVWKQGMSDWVDCASVADLLPDARSAARGPSSPDWNPYQAPSADAGSQAALQVPSTDAESQAAIAPPSTDAEVQAEGPQTADADAQCEPEPAAEAPETAEAAVQHGAETADAGAQAAAETAEAGAQAQLVANAHGFRLTLSDYPHLG